MSNSLESGVYNDVLEYLETSDKLGHSGKVELLTLLLKKYLILDTADILLTKKDLDAIVFSSKQTFVDTTLPMEMRGSSIPVDQADLPKLLIINSTIGHLNSLGCLKKVAKFDIVKR